MNLLVKLKETVLSVLPIMALVLLLGLTVAPLGGQLLVRFVIGGILLILGLTLFLQGVDIGILPIGEKIGSALTSKRNLLLLLGASFVIGFMVTVAEPDVQVLTGQIQKVVSSVNRWGMVIMIASGVALFMMLGLLRTMLNWPLSVVLIIAYVLLFALAFLCPKEYQAVAFDSGGATTGPMTVPFIMALGVGVAAVRSGDKNNRHDSNEDSFGLTGIASIGPIAAVCIYGIFNSSNAKGQVQLTDSAVEKISGIAGKFFSLIPHVLKEVSLALLPLLVMFAVFQITLLKLPKGQIRRTVIGLAYSFVGLSLFLLGVNGGFMDAGQELGQKLGSLAQGGFSGYTVLLILAALLFGAIVVCAEPAVWVLTEQVEDLSSGNISRRAMLTALSAGVAVSVSLSVVRGLLGFNLWFILIPGYAIALALSFFCPPMFTAVAFDSGGVASGPMTSTFILSFTLGASSASGGNPVTDAFGVIALVAMTPLIAIQVLGITYKFKLRKLKKTGAA